MLKAFHAALLLVFAATPAFSEIPYRTETDWLKLPEGRTEIGSMHGTVATSSADEVYINVEGTVRQRYAVRGPNPGLQVYAADGTYVRNVPDAPFDLHGFLIRKEPKGEFIYAVRSAADLTAENQVRAGLDREAVLKMTLDGKRVLTIAPSSIPDRFKLKTDDGRLVMRLTSIAVAPDGNIYAADGYASDYIHRFDKRGRYISSFGGKAQPYAFKTLHHLALDTRYTPARLIACDRGNGRIVHLSLDGEFLGVVAKDLLMPAAAAVRGNDVAVAEFRGRVSLLDQNGGVTALNANTVADEIGSNRVEPSKWRAGVVSTPHGITFDQHGNIFVAEYNLFGRVHKLTPAP